MSTFKLPSTQDNLEIEDVINNLVLLKDGSCAMVMQTNAINFGLLSEEEQDATIYAYAAFLNSLTFTIQILIRSETKDITRYINLLEDQEIKELNPAKKVQINIYKNFIRSLVTERNVLEKKFYLIVPFSFIELGGTQSVNAFSGKKGLPYEKSYILDKAKANLEPRRDHVLRQLGRIGLGARQLNTQELIQLLFSMYNPSNHGIKLSDTKDYAVPLVQPAYTQPAIKPATPQSISQPATPAPQMAPQVQTAPTPVFTPPAPIPQAANPAPPPVMTPSPVSPPPVLPPSTPPPPPVISSPPTPAYTPVPPTPTIQPSKPVSAPITPTPPVPPINGTPNAGFDPQAAINMAAQNLTQNYSAPTPPITSKIQ